MAMTGYTATYEITKTIDSSGGDYPDLATAEAAWDIDLVAGDSSITFNITGEQVEPATTIDGATTNPTHFITITSSGDGRHAGVYSASFWRIETASMGLTVSDNHTVIDGILVASTGAYAIQATGADSVTVKNCVFPGGTGAYAIFANNGLLVFNCVFYDWNTRLIRASGNSYYDIYGNTFVDCGDASGDYYLYNNASPATTDVRNNLFYHGSSNTVQGNGPLVVTGDYNATDSASLDYPGGSCGGSCGGNDVNNLSTTESNIFENYAGNDYRIKSGSGLPSVGVDLGAAYNTDIAGNARTWSIGAFEVEVAATVTKKTWIHDPTGIGARSSANGASVVH